MLFQERARDYTLGRGDEAEDRRQKTEVRSQESEDRRGGGGVGMRE